MQSTLNKKLEHRLNRHFMTCTAVAAGFSAVASERADAVVHYSGVRNIDVIVTDGTGFYLNLITDVTQNGAPGAPNVPGYDINIFDSADAVYTFCPTSTGVIGRYLTGYSYVDKLAAGTTIGPASAFINGGINSMVYGIPPISPATSWAGTGDIGFVGISFTEGSEFFGWLRVRIGPTVTGPYPVRVIDWAYEDNGGPIDTGQVPEPAAAALGFLALGALGTHTWRRPKRLPAQT